MRCVVEPDRSLRWFRLAMLATISVAAVSCSGETHRFESNPYRSQSSSNEVTGSIQQRHASVQSAPLPPPSTAGMQPPATRPAVTPPPAPAAAQRAWNWEGGTAITVQGDTIDGLVQRYGVPVSAIAEANNLPNGRRSGPDSVW